MGNLFRVTPKSSFDSTIHRPIARDEFERMRRDLRDAGAVDKHSRDLGDGFRFRFSSHPKAYAKTHDVYVTGHLDTGIYSFGVAVSVYIRQVGSLRGALAFTQFFSQKTHHVVGVDLTPFSHPTGKYDREHDAIGRYLADLIPEESLKHVTAVRVASQLVGLFDAFSQDPTLGKAYQANIAQKVLKDALMKIDVECGEEGFLDRSKLSPVSTLVESLSVDIAKAPAWFDQQSVTLNILGAIASSVL